MNQINCYNTSFIEKKTKTTLKLTTSLKVPSNFFLSLLIWRISKKSPLKYALEFTKSKLWLNCLHTSREKMIILRLWMPTNWLKKSTCLAASFSISVKQSGHTVLISFDFTYLTVSNCLVNQAKHGKDQEVLHCNSWIHMGRSL